MELNFPNFLLSRPILRKKKGIIIIVERQHPICSFIDIFFVDLQVKSADFKQINMDDVYNTT